MIEEVVSECVTQCDTTRIAWEYIIDHQGWIAWILGGTFALGNFTGWIVTTIYYMWKQIDKPQTIIVHPSALKGGTSKIQLPELSNESSSSEEITKLPESQ